MDQRLEKQMAFLLEADKSKLVGRQTYLADGSRKENDAEHSWHLALMCALLAEHAREPIDTARTMAMVLIHDLVEIDAGDTYAYDTAGNASKRERETAAADRIFSLLPEDQAAWMRGLWDEFEEGITAEAKFANTLDKIQPILLNDASGGKSWEEHGVREEQIRKRNLHTPEGSETLWDYADGLIRKNVENGKIKR
ncbi:MAG: HD domain-containing protein [Candidatus Limivivens sp.]|nr:HD domain-containing protein [Lachnospiraceae bacterium]MDY3919418.1 HD domain-containing protein [Candidatus Limivivens sp.]